MKKRRLCRRVRDWLRKRKERKEDKSLPSFGNRLINDDQEQLAKPKESYKNEKPAQE
ncbi:hypothetical protein [Neobacillus mesonae]|uniref:hypothetical protein n=1 Tax=Neobacillus mesonae TaxID=1193713 RepID=UPI0013DFBFE8|nr:hypothetical protein [Neobacillus mesonae]